MHAIHSQYHYCWHSKVWKANSEIWKSGHCRWVPTKFIGSPPFSQRVHVHDARNLNALSILESLQNIAWHLLGGNTSTTRIFCHESDSSKRTLGHFLAITAMVGPPTYPAPIQQILTSNSSPILFVCCVCCWLISNLSVVPAMQCLKMIFGIYVWLKRRIHQNPVDFERRGTNQVSVPWPLMTGKNLRQRCLRLRLVLSP